jgi:tetratricopeptide (TPR) repeat protein
MNDLLLQAVALQRAGRVDEAEALCRRILQANPAHAGALNLLGGMARMRGDHVRALDLIRHAIEAQPNHAAYHHNLAAVYREMGKFDEAIHCCQSALELQPDQLESHVHIGLAYQFAKRWRDAERIFREISTCWPKAPHGPQALGDCARQQGRMHEAVEFYREALARSPDLGPVHLILGTHLLTSDDPATAEQHLRRAAELLPRNLPALVNLGSCLTRLKREREALSVYKQALPLAPHDVMLNVNIGLALVGCGNYSEAEKWLASALRVDPNNVGALSGMGIVFREKQRPEEAIPLYERALQLDPDCDAYRGLADALWDVGEIERAEQLLRDACKRHPNNAEARSRLGTVLIAAGDFAAAEATLRDALEIDPYYPQALTELARLLGRRLSDETRSAMNEAARRPAPAEPLAGLHFAIAHVEDARDNYSLAAEQLRRGNALANEHWAAIGRSYDAKSVSGDLTRALAIFGPDCFCRAAEFGDPTDQPVFVVGMQRSGTSLVEQILASHPRVFGAGESGTVSQSLLRLPSVMGLSIDAIECVGQITRESTQDSAHWCLERLRRRVNKPADRIIDKTPVNYLFLGWLHILFPKAKFIHCRRDLRDVALSCWMTHFSTIRWANDLGHITSQIRDYRKVMEHWRKNLPVPLLEIDYERLVADQESESRRLIEWLGLEWDPACL